jgi:hypothetical protein
MPESNTSDGNWYERSSRKCWPNMASTVPHRQVGVPVARRRPCNRIEEDGVLKAVVVWVVETIAMEAVEDTAIMEVVVAVVEDRRLGIRLGGNEMVVAVVVAAEDPIVAMTTVEVDTTEADVETITVAVVVEVEVAGTGVKFCFVHRYRQASPVASCQLPFQTTLLLLLEDNLQASLFIGRKVSS